MKATLFLLMFALAGVTAAPQDPARSELVQETPSVEPAELGTTRNLHRAGDLWLAGQFTPGDVALFHPRGIRRVITLRAPGEVDWDEQGAVEDAGLAFEALAITGPPDMTAATFDRVRALLAEESGPTLLHCGSANRVAATWIPYRVLDQSVPLEQALEEAETIGLRTPAYREAAIAYVQDRTSVKEGINDTFKDPELDVQRFVERFEVESREVYVARDALVAATGVRPGARMADVGAGTGLFTLLFAEAVGPNGWVYAVDIAPRFVEHIRARAVEDGFGNVTGVLGAERSITLPPASVEVVYVCDTYHHFEYPKPVLASIRRALVPGGRLVVVDFERIPGVSREWILGHVRAGRETVQAEIEAAGFVFARELAVEGLEENYALEFRVPAD